LLETAGLQVVVINPAATPGEHDATGISTVVAVAHEVVVYPLLALGATAVQLATGVGSELLVEQTVST
jgi:hypothetical protein